MKYKLSNSDNNKNISLQKGDEIIITLEENPTTGYRWHWTDLDKKIFEIEKDDYEIHSDAIGGGGVREFKLKARKTGKATIELINIRNFDSQEESIGNFQISVNVK